MSKALGTFEHNWTLNCVCDECNQFFGDTFELVLGRDSIEGFLRVETGVKPPDAINAFLNRRAVFTLQDAGPLEGARIVMRAVNDVIAPDAPPQVGFRCPGQDWHYFMERDLNSAAIERIDCPSPEIKLIGRHGEEDLARLVSSLAELGIQFSETSRSVDQPLSSGQTVGVVHEFIVDTVLRRAAAKIGFNYLASVLGARTANRPDFDSIRAFIRHGEEPEPLVSAQELSILTGPEAESSQTHACAFAWEPSRKELIGVVTLFNRVTYGIRLCHSSSDEWIGISATHSFNPIARTISVLSMAQEE